MVYEKERERKERERNEPNSRLNKYVQAALQEGWALLLQV